MIAGGLKRTNLDVGWENIAPSGSSAAHSCLTVQTADRQDRPGLHGATCSKNLCQRSNGSVCRWHPA